MTIQLVDLIIRGQAGVFQPNTTREELMQVLGPPHLHERARRSYPEMLNYGDLECWLRDGVIQVVALSFQSAAPILYTEEPIIGLEDSALRSQPALLSQLAAHGIQYRIDDIMTDETQTVYVTEKDVHLCFVEEKLGRLVVQLTR